VRDGVSGRRGGVVYRLCGGSIRAASYDLASQLR
jgi:hypothetical protein